LWQGIHNNCTPEKINADKSGSNTAAINAYTDDAGEVYADDHESPSAALSKSGATHIWTNRDLTLKLTLIPVLIENVDSKR
jgi:hypothetical protein